MPILEPSKEDLQKLSSDDLEELVLRLCECDLKKFGGKVTSVKRLGDINTSDGGIDVIVDEDLKNFSTEFIPLNDTGFQVKKSSIPPNKIKSEMAPSGKILKSISDLNDIHGAYIIVSTSPFSQEQFDNRINAMNEVINKFGSKKSLVVDIYDLSKIHQWLRQHLSVMIWVNSKIGKNTVGWQSYGRWSRPPKDDEDYYILSDELSVTIPSISGNSYPNIVGLDYVRKVIQGSSDSIRINGLKGVGKTRFAQALFEDTINSEPLDRTNVIYCDINDSPIFTPDMMVEHLLAEKFSPILVLDNCPLEKHIHLSKRLSSIETRIRLVSIDYQVDEAFLENTCPVRVFSRGPKVAKALLNRRYPDFGEIDSWRVANLAKGNPTLSCAVLDRFKYEKKSLSNFSDSHLVDRLFFQRSNSDENFRRIARVFSLVDSFLIDESNPNHPELEVLAELAGSTSNQLYSFAKTLEKRGIIQKKGDNLLGIEPTVLANQLANEALNEISIPRILKLFEADSNIRLLVAFSKRLRYLHNNSNVQKIVKNWLGQGGILNDFQNLEQYKLEIIENTAPINPDMSFEIIHNVLNSKNYEILMSKSSNTRQTLLNLIARSAYENDNFETCADFLIKTVKFDQANGGSTEVKDMLYSLFQPIFSGSKAPIDRKKNFVEQLIKSSDQYYQEIGFSILDKILSKTNWNFNEILGFGAHPLGDEITTGQVSLKEWYLVFLDLIIRYGTNDNERNSSIAQGIIVNNIIWLADLKFIREGLEETIKVILKDSEWPELWVEIRKWISAYKESDFRTKTEILEFLMKLEKIVRPSSVFGEVKAFVLKSKYKTMYLNDTFVFGSQNEISVSDAVHQINEKCSNLGKKFIEADCKIAILGEELFEYRENSILQSFGNGLAQVKSKIGETWIQLVRAFESSEEVNPSPAVIGGFIEAVDQIDKSQSRTLLAKVPSYPKLAKHMFDLYPQNSFTKDDFENCIQSIANDDLDINSKLKLLQIVQYSDFGENEKRTLTDRLFNSCTNETEKLELIASFIIYGFNYRKRVDPYITEVGYEIVKKTVHTGFGRIEKLNSNLSTVLLRYLATTNDESEKDQWCEILFTAIAKNKIIGSLSSLHILHDTASLLPQRFLRYVFDDEYVDGETRNKILEFSQVSGSILSEIEPKILIEWCQKRSDPEIWESIAMGIKCLDYTGNHKTFKFSQVAKDFLDACPDPQSVLNCFAKSIYPQSYSGNISDEMDYRLNAFKHLENSTNTTIANAARNLIQKQSELIIQEKKKEK